MVSFVIKTKYDKRSHQFFYWGGNILWNVRVRNYTLNFIVYCNWITKNLSNYIKKIFLENIKGCLINYKKLKFNIQQLLGNELLSQFAKKCAIESPWNIHTKREWDKIKRKYPYFPNITYEWI